MSGQIPVKPSPDSIANSVKTARGKGLPPVHLWNPPFCGDLDIRIARDGSWYYQNGKINRVELVRLFSSILKKEGDKYFLVTPVEKVGIIVDDAPFVAVDFDQQGSGSTQDLTFSTQVGDTAVAGPEHAIRVIRDPDTDEPAPYIHIRSGLDARIDRKSFYRLVDLGTDHDGWFGVWSSGQFFGFVPSDELENL